jgi:hypothetical protein
MGFSFIIGRTTVIVRVEECGTMTVVLPTMIETPSDIKTAHVGESQCKKAIRKGRSQIFGHLGKWVMGAFGFGGAGQDARVVGLLSRICRLK